MSYLTDDRYKHLDKTSKDDLAWKDKHRAEEELKRKKNATKAELDRLKREMFIKRQDINRLSVTLRRAEIDFERESFEVRSKENVQKNRKGRRNLEVIKHEEELKRLQDEIKKATEKVEKEKRELELAVDGLNDANQQLEKSKQEGEREKNEETRVIDNLDRAVDTEKKKSEQLRLKIEQIKNQIAAMLHDEKQLEIKINQIEKTL